MKKILTLLFLLPVYACAANVALYESYQNFEEHIKDRSNKIDGLVGYFAKEVVDQALSDIKKGDAEDKVVSNLSFPHIMKNEISHFEKTAADGDVGCLTVNGYESSNSPVSFSLLYTKEQGRWLIKDMFIAMPEKVEDLPNYAQCPDEAEASF
ncbi:hypothetical protein WH50_04200 [Pokkaliibacter plantistimulans]|uniref:DUF3828 domain-containing protein n=1 Tax=Pokkaliibacter plantistimulans TaxID=1635171 RepID=A0ABX5M1W3_9GAMM|nr:hypothetical protein [Pokkaliibacter plantistimulans]PXF32492.1 hypothetical protein WH50_04200 [Pokkaliibacter plantistimulans]